MSITFPMRGEFDFIRNIKDKYRLDSIGDDCAVLPRDAETDLLITADLLVEDVDFRLAWTQPELLGHKALAISLSDIAAMGGAPKYALLSIGAPAEIWQSDFLDRFYVGWHDLAKRYGLELVGGDVSRSPGGLVVDSVVMGTVARGTAVLRKGAMPGNAIFVSGRLGGAAGGLRFLEKSQVRPHMNQLGRLELRQLRPEPRIDLGRYLRDNGLATSMIDISDGLSSDLHHLCLASGVGACIDSDAIPIDEGLEDLTNDSQHEALELALNGGEDFELLFTVPREKISILKDTDFHRVGEVTETVGLVELRIDGKRVALEPKGYTHF